MDSNVRVPNRRIWTNFEISNQKRSLSFEANDPGPSLSGSIWLVLPPTRLTRLENKLIRPNVYSLLPNRRPIPNKRSDCRRYQKLIREYYQIGLLTRLNPGSKKGPCFQISANWLQKLFSFLSPPTIKNTGAFFCQAMSKKFYCVT